MMSSLQLPARGVAGRLSTANVRGVASSLPVSEPLTCPFASEPLAIGCTAVVLTAASLVVTILGGRDHRQPARKPAEKVTAPKTTIRASRDWMSSGGRRVICQDCMLVDRRGWLRLTQRYHQPPHRSTLTMTPSAASIRPTRHTARNTGV